MPGFVGVWAGVWFHRLMVCMTEKEIGRRAPAATPEALFRRLAELGIETETRRHEPLFTVDQSRALRGAIPGGHCKCLFLTAKLRALWLVVALEDREIDLKALARHLGAGRFSFAKAELLMDALGVAPGAVTPFALINDRAGDVTVVLDAEMLEHDPLNYHPLVNTKTTAIGSED
ncbi:MAG: prolyl-tRNA synthetase associated domain-containing protein, partial [Alphaproteobacteria bacterium]